jgi:hypothetical protein
MGDTYTRQSSATIVDGGTIEASHFNAEFDQLLAAFAASSGHTHDGTAGEGGPVTKLLGNTLTFGAGTAGTDITITFDGESNDGVLKWMEDEDYFEFSDDILVASTEKLQFRDTDIYINSSADGQLDLVADTEIQIAATTVDINGNVDISGTLTVGGALDFSDAAITNVGSLQLDSIAGDADSNTSITFSGSDIITIATGGENQVTFTNGAIVPSTDNDLDLGTSSVEFKDAFFDGTVTTDAIVVAGTIGHDDDTDLLTLADGIVTVAGEVSMTTLDIGGTNVTSTAAELNILDGVTSTTAELNILDGVTSTASELNLVDGITAGTVSASKAVIVDSNKDLTGLRNLTISGDLTVSGDDITMGTNTAGNLLIADGTNFNSVAVGSLSEISTVENDDVFLAVDTSGGGLKKITRSAVVAGLATSSAISNVADDSTPQLGGDLDVNGNDIVSVSNGNINLLPNGSGKVILDGNGSSGGVSITDGLIDIRTGTGEVTKVKFYCESSNAHAQTLQAQPHSASSSAVVVLPVASGTLVGSGDSGTVTNTMLAGSIADSKLSTITTAGKVDIGALEIDGATDIGADLADADLLIVDDGGGGTERKSAMSRIPTYVFSKVSGDATVASNGALTIASDAVEQSMIADDAVGADQLASSAVVTASIVDDAVTQAKIADDAVGADQLASDAVVNASIASNAAIADSKLDTISTADKVSGAAIQIDGATDGTSITVASTDKLLVDDAGTTKYINVSQLPASATALDDIGTGDAASTLATSAGNITIDAQGDDTDIIFKGTDGGADTTFLTIDGSDAGKLLPNNGIDLNGKELILDADADTSITSDTDDQIDIRIAGADDFTFTANTFTAASGSTIAAQALTATTITPSSNIDMNGTELILDADADTSITADTDDQIDIKIANADHIKIATSSGDTVLQPLTDAKDIIINQYDGNELVNFNDGGYSSFTRAAFFPEATLTDASTISWDVSTSSVAKVTLGGNRTLGAATNAQTGQFVSLLIIQDGTGSRTVTFNAAYEFTGDTAPTLTTTVDKGDLFVFRYNGSKFLEVGRNLNLTLS